MKLLFWLSAILVFVANGFFLNGFINVYFKNYNGGRESSSGSIYRILLVGIAIFVAGIICYFTGNIRWALGIMGVPVLLAGLYIFVRVILPVLLGGRMN